MFAVAVQKQQPLKQRLKKKLSTFDEKREEWVMKRKNNHNIASIKDEAIIMLEKLHAIGYKPVLVLGKQTKKKEIKWLTPRCRLTAYAKEYLQKMGSFYEYLCEGWNQDSTENADGVTINDEEYFTLHLAPCEPPEDANSEKEAIIQAQEVGEARTMELEEASTSRADDIQTTKGEVDPLSNPEGQVEQVNNKTNKDVTQDPPRGEILLEVEKRKRRSQRKPNVDLRKKGPKRSAPTTADYRLSQSGV